MSRSEPHIVIPYVVIWHDKETSHLAFRTNFGDYRGSEPIDMDDEDSKRLAIGRIIESVLRVTGKLRLDIEFLV